MTPYDSYSRGGFDGIVQSILFYLTFISTFFGVKVLYISSDLRQVDISYRFTFKNPEVFSGFLF